jgi:hypothetical protein
MPDNFDTGVTAEQAKAYLVSQGYSLLGMTDEMARAAYNKYAAYDIYHKSIWGF